jgi:hypothetical protein
LEKKRDIKSAARVLVMIYQKDLLDEGQKDNNLDLRSLITETHQDNYSLNHTDLDHGRGGRYLTAQKDTGAHTDQGLYFEFLI